MIYINNWVAWKLQLYRAQRQVNPVIYRRLISIDEKMFKAIFLNF